MLSYKHVFKKFLTKCVSKIFAIQSCILQILILWIGEHKWLSLGFFFCFFIGVTFNSVHYNDDVYTQNIGGTIFAFNHQDIRIWAMSGESCSFMYIVYVSLCLQEGQ